MHRLALERARATAQRPAGIPDAAHPIAAERSRQREARRVGARQFRLPRGWRAQVPDDLVVMVDQRDALARIIEAVDLMGRRSDWRTHAVAVLEVLVFGMARDTGAVCGVTHAELTRRAQVSESTVTRVIRWAREAGVVVVVERPASATFLGLEHGRAPAYVITAPAPAPSDLSTSTDRSDDPPASSVGRTSPQDERHEQGLNRSAEKNPAPALPWGFYDRPTTPQERGRAADRVMDHLSTPQQHRRRVKAMLSAWFTDGWCVAGLVFAAGHHPDDPSEAPRDRGNVFRGARDPVAVLGGRLAPWRGRIADLPGEFHAVDTDARSAHAAAIVTQLDEELDVAGRRERPEHVPTSSTGHRAALLAALRAIRHTR